MSTRGLPRGGRSAIEWVALASLIALAAILAWTDLWAADVWWQLATGRWILEHRAVPRADPFSYATAGREWIEPRWGYELLLYLLYRAGGPAALVAVKTAILGIVFATSFAAAPRGKGAGIAMAAAGLAIVAASDRFRVRPEIATYLAIAVSLAILERVRRTGRSRPLVLVPLVALLWANLHGLAFLAPCLVLAYGAGSEIDRARRRGSGRGRKSRRPRLAYILCLVATAGALLANPYGWKAAYKLPWQLFSEIRADHVYARWITEFWPPTEHSGAYVAAFWGLAALVVVLIVATIRRAPTPHILVGGAFLGLATLAVRNVPLFALASLPVAFSAAGRIVRGRRRGGILLLVDRALLGMCPAAALAGVFLVATDRAYVAEDSTRRFGCGVSAYQFPILATEFALENPLPGRVFAEMGDASYLIWKGFEVPIDGRLELHTPEAFGRYLDVAWGRVLPQKAPGLEDVGWCLVDHGQLGLLVRRLSAPDSGWRLVYVDGTHAIYVLDDQRSRSRLGELERRYGGLPVERLERARSETGSDWRRARAPVESLRLGWFYHESGRPERAIEFFEKADAIRPLTPPARLRLAESCLALGARVEGGIVTVADPGALAKAKAAFRRVLDQDPHSAAAHGGLGFLADYLDGDRGRAIRHYREFLRLGGRDEGVSRRIEVIEAGTAIDR